MRQTSTRRYSAIYAAIPLRDIAPRRVLAEGSALGSGKRLLPSVRDSIESNAARVVAAQNAARIFQVIAVTGSTCVQLIFASPHGNAALVDEMKMPPFPARPTDTSFCTVDI